MFDLDDRFFKLNLSLLTNEIIPSSLSFKIEILWFKSILISSKLDKSHKRTNSLSYLPQNTSKHLSKKSLNSSKIELDILS